jgi:hypothetical protein
MTGICENLIIINDFAISEPNGQIVELYRACSFAGVNRHLSGVSRAIQLKNSAKAEISCTLLSSS